MRKSIFEIQLFYFSGCVFKTHVQSINVTTTNCCETMSKSVFLSAMVFFSSGDLFHKIYLKKSIIIHFQKPSPNDFWREIVEVVIFLQLWYGFTALLFLYCNLQHTFMKSLTYNTSRILHVHLFAKKQKIIQIKRFI